MTEVNRKSKSSAYWHGNDTFVISTDDVEKLKALFEGAGLVFSKEQHGEGPVHWCVATKSGAFEIYPKDYKQVEANKAKADNKSRMVESRAVQPFKIPPNLNRQFMFDIASGIGFCTRKYGVTKEQILLEIKRIAPHMNVDVLRE